MIINYSFGGDEYEVGDDFEYEVDYIDVQDALRHIIKKEFKIKKEDEKALKLLDFIIKDLDVDDALEAYFEDDLRDYFYDEAYEAYCDACEYEKDPLGYFGMSQRDFIKE
jgi:hypothetical protein